MRCQSYKQLAVFLMFAVSSTWGVCAERPNIVLILADDLGYNDIGVFGCPDVPTPHIDAIADNGVKFTDGYANNVVCSASRAGLLSGMYQQRFGFENNSGPEEYAAPHFGIPRAIPIIAERLKEAGYVTGMLGKWHVGFNQGLRPEDRGFDYTWGFRAGARNFFPEGRQAHTIFQNGKPVPPDFEYITDELGKQSVDFINRHQDEPFF
jgi:arylsulfatase A-like enzyme